MAIITTANFRGEIRLILGETAASFWIDSAPAGSPIGSLNTLINECIQEVQSLVPKGALREMMKEFRVAWVAGGVLYVEGVIPDFYDLISFRTYVDPLYTPAWDIVSHEYLHEVRSAEGNLAFASTSTRLIAWSADFTAGSRVLECYPNPLTGETYSIKYYKKFSETPADLDMPTNPNIRELVLYRVVSLAASRKGRDWTLHEAYDEKFKTLLNAIITKYSGKEGVKE